MTKVLQLFDSYLKKIIQISPETTVEKGIIKIYSCGPTVYFYQHIGNMDAVFVPDLINRVAVLAGFEVRWVSNITDGHLVGDGDEGEDKLELGAKRENKNVQEIINHYNDDFRNQASSIRVNLPVGKYNPRATEYILEQMLLAVRLLDKELAYITDIGIYIDSQKVTEILETNSSQHPTLVPILKNLDLASKENSKFTDREIVSGARHLADFVIWKFVDEKALQKWKFEDFPEIMWWFDKIKASQINKSPKHTVGDGEKLQFTPRELEFLTNVFDLEKIKIKWGCPGWHSECVCMISQTVGNKLFDIEPKTKAKSSQFEIDIHTGGEDHIDIHHQNEIIQSEALGFHLSKYWVHNKFITVDGQKMSKSLGNVYLVLGTKEVTGFETIQEHGFLPLAFRMLLLEHDYRQQINFTWDKLAQSQTRLLNLRKSVSQIVSYALSQFSIYEVENTVVENKQLDFYLEIALDNLNTPKLLEKLQQLIDETVTDILQKDQINLKNLTLIKKLDESLLDLDLFVIAPDTIYELLNKRSTAKANKDYQASDQIRNQLKELGWQVDDYSWGSGVWKMG
jgi:cysteinyl-tRNA synthetase